MAAAGGNGRGPDATGVTPVALRPAGLGDADVVAQLHAGEIAEGFLSSLGPRFLERLYRRVCRSPGSFLLVAEASGQVVGFVAGSVDTRKLYARFLVRDGVPALFAAPRRILSSLGRVAETLRHGRDGAATSADGELLAIAVRPEARGQGVGRRLVDALLGEMERRHVHTVEVVVGEANAAAVALYTASGFTPARRFELHRGTASLALHHRSDGPAAPGPISA